MQEKRSTVIIIGVIITVLLGIAILWGRFFLSAEESNKVEQIFLLNEPNIEILDALHEQFPGAMIQKESEHHFSKFLKGNAIIFAYDVQVPLLIEGGAYYYPVYEDPVVLVQKVGFPEISGWAELRDYDYSVSLIREEPKQRFLWQAASWGLENNFKKQAAIGLWKNLYQKNLLFWDMETASVRVSFHSHALDPWVEEKTRIIFPMEGTLSYGVGILSAKPLSNESVQKIRRIHRQNGYLVFEREEEKQRFQEKHHLEPAWQHLPEVESYGSLKTVIHREIEGIKKHVPAETFEHQIASLILVIAITLGIGWIKKTVIHRGIKRGLVAIGIILLGWLGLQILKYSFFGDAIYIRYLWYAYYVFILSIPPTSLYIAGNINCYNQSLYPKWQILLTVISVGFMFLVLSNDFHQFVFRFLTSNEDLWHKHYSYGPGYVIMAVWVVLLQSSGWGYLWKKSWDSPRRTKALASMLLLVFMGMYTLLYNFRIPFFRDIPYVLGMSFLMTLFWAGCIQSGLIPSNFGYRELFEKSQLDMQIFDRAGNLCYHSQRATPLRAFFPEGQSLILPQEESLVWSTSIRGGQIVTKENISDLSKLKRKLEKVNQKLEAENEILSRQNQIESRLILIREQKELTNKVNQLVESRIHRMMRFLERMKKCKEKSELIPLQGCGIYCKRSCEIMLRSKQQKQCGSQDIRRLMEEVNDIISKDYTFFCEEKTRISYSLMALLYETYHIVVEACFWEGIPSLTANLKAEKDSATLYLWMEGNEKLFRDRIRGMKGPYRILSCKNLGESFSMQMEIREDDVGGRIL